MSRPSTITDEQILSAARAVFLEKGIRAKSAEVARRAGCAEGSIFNRFKTKADLFRAAMSPQLDDPAWLKNLTERVGVGDMRENLAKLGLEVIEFFRTLLPLIMMSWSNPSEAHGDPTGHVVDMMSMPNPPPVRALKMLSGFFEAEIRNGRLRRHDPEVMARVFLGALQHFAFVELLTREGDELPMSAESFLRGLANLIWVGAEPRAEGSPRASRASGKSEAAPAGEKRKPRPALKKRR